MKIDQKIKDLLDAIGNTPIDSMIDFEGLAAHYEALGLLRRRKRFEGLFWWLGFERYA